MKTLFDAPQDEATGFPSGIDWRRMMRSSSYLAIVVRTACRFGFFCAAALLTVASVVGAADTDRTVSEFLDSNSDHRISYDEFVHSLAVKARREMDEDKDGLLTPAEGTASGAREDTRIPPINFSEVDANGDGRVSLDELKQAIHTNTGVNELFQKLDKNGDGFLDESELNGTDAAPLLKGAPLIHFRF